MAPHRLHLEAQPYSGRVEPVEITPVELKKTRTPDPLTHSLQRRWPHPQDLRLYRLDKFVCSVGRCATQSSAS